MKSSPTISYATTVCNEHEELHRLLIQLVSIVGPDDEIVIQGDQGKVSDQVVSVLHKYRKNAQVKYVEYPLRKNFAQYKNNLFKECTKDYIVNIDADEMLASPLAESLRSVLAENSDIDMFRLPRINIVSGLTKEWIHKWNWNVNSQGWVNFPDYQCRIIRNGLGIKWTHVVHEVLVGFKTTADFPDDPDYALIHVKELDRQIKQNEFYSTF